MARTADYTIEGFMYQFQVSLFKLLSSKANEEVEIEGIIEDIEIRGANNSIEAIQCKYHSTNQNFTLSAIYKPVLQMLTHFQNNKTASIKYRLFAHFPNEIVNTQKKLTKEEIKTILSSSANDLQKLIAGLSGFTDITLFLKKFDIFFGPSYENNEKTIKALLVKEANLTTEDVEQIFYPNALNQIAELSILHDVQKRKIRKKDFLKDILKSKKTIVSRWTKELKTYEALLKKRRSQLHDNLNTNGRKRCLIIDSDFIEQFDSKIVQLIEEFVNKYNFKIHLHACPIVVLDCEIDKLNEICEQLHHKKIDVERGFVGGKLNVQKFLRDPIKNIKQGKVEFKVKICRYEIEFDALKKAVEFDDVIIISNKQIEIDLINETNIEWIETPVISEIKYLLSLNSHL